MEVPGSVASYRGFVRTIAKVEATDEKTVVITTDVPNPLLPVNLSTVYIVNKKASENADFNSGKALVGSGPYTLESYVPGDRLQLKRNEDYWAEKPEWDAVDYRYIANPAARTAALLAGDVDVIDKVSLADLVQ